VEKGLGELARVWRGERLATDGDSGRIVDGGEIVGPSVGRAFFNAPVTLSGSAVQGNKK
jgi:hypothetical protein